MFILNLLFVVGSVRTVVIKLADAADAQVAMVAGPRLRLSLLHRNLLRSSGHNYTSVNISLITLRKA